MSGPPYGLTDNETVIVVEDGNNLTNSNSYIDVAYLTQYAINRGITIQSSNPAQLIVLSMDYVEGLQFRGEKFTRNQPLQWPRWDVIIDNFLVTVHSIPWQLQQGQAEICLAIDRGINPISDIPRIKEAIRVGDVSIQYHKGMAVTLVRRLNHTLWKLLKQGLGPGSFLTGRG